MVTVAKNPTFDKIQDGAGRHLEFGFLADVCNSNVMTAQTILIYDKDMTSS